MDKKKVDRINELARIAKQRPLTEEETREQEALRREYITEFRRKLRSEG